jgi:hypothetical protein
VEEFPLPFWSRQAFLRGALEGPSSAGTPSFLVEARSAGRAFLVEASLLERCAGSPSFLVEANLLERRWNVLPLHFWSRGAFLKGVLEWPFLVGEPS